MSNRTKSMSSAKQFDGMAQMMTAMAGKGMRDRMRMVQQLQGDMAKDPTGALSKKKQGTGRAIDERPEDQAPQGTRKGAPQGKTGQATRLISLPAASAADGVWYNTRIGQSSHGLSARRYSVMASVPQSMPSEPEFAWEIATIFPVQGEWSANEYLHLANSTNRRVELADGRLEFLPMPTTRHEDLCQFLFLRLLDHVTGSNIGRVYFAGIRVRVGQNRYRMPDVLFLSNENMHLRQDPAWEGTDLAIEVVSDDPKDHHRDYETKLVDYAEAAIREYWIVDPKTRTVQVHKLDGNNYALHGEFGEGETATSVLLSGFEVDVRALFAVMDDRHE